MQMRVHAHVCCVCGCVHTFMHYYVAQHEPSLWLQYVEDTFVVWAHGPQQLQDFLSHFNSLRLSIQFTMEMESDTAIPLHVLATKVDRNPTHTGQYLNFKSNHSQCVRCLINALHNRASIKCQDQNMFNEISNPRCNLQLNGYSQHLTASVINFRSISHMNKEEKHLSCVYPICQGCFRTKHWEST